MFASKEFIDSNNKDMNVARYHRLSSAPMRTREVIIVLILACLLATGLGMILIQFRFVTTGVLILSTWLSSLLALSVLWSYIFLRNKGTIPLRSDVLVMLGFSLSNLIPPLYLSLRIFSEPRVDIFNVADMYPMVSVITMIGGLSFLFGYKIIEGRINIKQLVNPALDRPKATIIIYIALWFILIVAWGARIFLLYKGAYYWVYSSTFLSSRWYSIASQISSYGLIVPILFWLLVNRKPRLKYWAWIFTVAELIWILPSGARGEIIITLFGLLLISYWKNGRLPKIKTVFLIAFVVIMMVIISQYRYVIHDFTDIDRISFSATKDAIQASYNLFSLSASGNLKSWIDPVVQRVYDGQFMGYLLKNFRDTYNWEYGKTYFTRLPYIFLPYFIYTQRPVMQVPINHWFKLISGGSTPTTFLGEAYINFGYLGIPFIAFLMGIILGGYDKLFFKHRNNIFFTAVWLLFGSRFPFMVTQSFAAWLALLRNAVLMLLVFYLVFELLEGTIFTPSTRRQIYRLNGGKK